MSNEIQLLSFSEFKQLGFKHAFEDIDNTWLKGISSNVGKRLYKAVTFVEKGNIDFEFMQLKRHCSMGGIIIYEKLNKPHQPLRSYYNVILAVKCDLTTIKKIAKYYDLKAFF